MSRQFQFAHGNFNFTHGNFNLFTAISVSLTAISISLTAISISLTAISICSRQFQFAHGNFSFTHGNFNILTAISTCSRLFQFTHGNFAILLIDKALSIFSRQRSQHFSLRTLPVSYSRRQYSGLAPKVKTQIESRYFKSIFKEESENHKSKVNLRTSLN